MRIVTFPIVLAAAIGLAGVTVPALAARSAGSAGSEGTGTPPIAGAESARNPSASAQAAELFDDFSYENSSDTRLSERGWTVRTGEGGPGVPGAEWSAVNVTFPTIGDQAGTAVQLEAATDGTAAGTIQSELYHQRKFYEGTYAARVRFSDEPVGGPDGDQLVQTFFTITPLEFPNDPDYGEIDFEYLPNGGWGESGPTLFTTTWETYDPNGQSDNVHDTVAGSQAGWHELLVQVSDGQVRYFLDGTPIADHGGTYYPETPMSINLNHWFIAEGLQGSSESRSYVEQVDYVYFGQDQVLSPTEVTSRVNGFREASVEWKDSVKG